MTQSFDDAWKENRHVWESTKNIAKAMYLAGAQSRQAEIDELQARIDEVLDYVGTDFDDYYTGIMIESIHEILKGTANEQ